MDGFLVENGRYLVALHEVKNEIGEGGSDPFLQASFSCLNFWKQDKASPTCLNRVRNMYEY